MTTPNTNETALQRADDARRVTTTPTRKTIQPSVDVFENENEFLVVAELPGVRADGLDVRLDTDELVVRGEVSTSIDGTVLLGQPLNVVYERTFAIPTTVDREQVSANVSDGVLHLRLPKAASARPRRIEVRTS